MYLKKLEEIRKEEGKNGMEYLTATTKSTPESKALEFVKIERQCCRRHYLAHVDLM